MLKTKQDYIDEIKEFLGMVGVTILFGAFFVALFILA